MTDLDASIRALYQGPIEDFIGRRHALARQLRADKRREDADRVKALRKPSRSAWALDQVVFEDPALIAHLERAILGAQQAHGAADRVRAAQDDVRAAVRSVADAGARIAARDGNAVASTALVTALRAVISVADAFAALRAGRLVEIPEGGGLDLLVSMAPPGPRLVSESPPDRKVTQREEAAAVRAELQRAQAVLAEARERTQVARRAVLRAQAGLEAAEERLEQTRKEAAERRAELERAQREASIAADEVGAAEASLAELGDRGLG